MRSPGTLGTVAGITDLLAIATSAICVLLATVRTGEDGGTKLVGSPRSARSHSCVALAILQILDHDVEIGPRVYAILATAYVAAAAVLLILRLLPAEDPRPTPASAAGDRWASDATEPMLARPDRECFASAGYPASGEDYLGVVPRGLGDRAAVVAL